jgi:hypothetical protein
MRYIFLYLIFLLLFSDDVADNKCFSKHQQ